MKYLLPFLLIVITDPYKGLKRDEITVYTYEKEYRSIDMTEHTNDANMDSHDYNDESGYYEDEAKEDTEVNNYTPDYFIPWFIFRR